MHDVYCFVKGLIITLFINIRSLFRPNDSHFDGFKVALAVDHDGAIHSPRVSSALLSPSSPLAYHVIVVVVGDVSDGLRTENPTRKEHVPLLFKFLKGFTIC